MERGSYLVCSGSEAGEYHDCDSFYQLLEDGCIPWTSSDQNFSENYDNICQQYLQLGKISIPQVDYFNIESEEWWQNLTAEVIPLRGDVKSAPDMYPQANEEREKLVKGKLLGEIDFLSVEPNIDAAYRNIHRRYLFIIGMVEEWEEDACEVWDEFVFSPVLLADFDQDGVGELLLSGGRYRYSFDCLNSLGSGNFVGAYFDVLVNKDSPAGEQQVVPYP